MPLPVSVLIVTKNEERRLPRCLDSLNGAFGETIVTDSESADRTREIALARGAVYVPFRWNGQLPKKRQWCLENIPLRHEWVFFLDADEEATPGFIAALSGIDWARAQEAGFFVPARYVMQGRALKGGLRNNKLCLFHRARMAFPPVDDRAIPGMGEMEGHYQPVTKAGFAACAIGQIKAPLLHHAFDGGFDKGSAWAARHERYAAWEAGMDEAGLWPQDPVRSRRILKAFFKALPCRAEIAFLHSYVLKAGFRDGLPGIALAQSRWRYYRMIRALKKR